MSLGIVQKSLDFFALCSHEVFVAGVNLKAVETKDHGKSIRNVGLRLQLMKIDKKLIREIRSKFLFQPFSVYTAAQICKDNVDSWPVVEVASWVEISKRVK